MRKEHADFMKDYPNGEMTKPQFIKRCISQYNSSEEQAENLFNVFDGDNSETIDFAEFIMASHATTLRCVIIIAPLGKPVQKSMTKIFALS